MKVSAFSQCVLVVLFICFVGFYGIIFLYNSEHLLKKNKKTSVAGNWLPSLLFTILNAFVPVDFFTSTIGSSGQAYPPSSTPAANSASSGGGKMKREKTTSRVSSKRPEEEEVSVLHQKKNSRFHIGNTQYIRDNIICMLFQDDIFQFLFETETAQIFDLVCLHYTQCCSCLFPGLRWLRHWTFQPFHFPSATLPCPPSASPHLFHLPPPPAPLPMSRPLLLQRKWAQIRLILKVFLHFIATTDLMANNILKLILMLLFLTRSHQQPWHLPVYLLHFLPLLSKQLLLVHLPFPHQ